ncbi:MAG: plastocyanin/azurin family copper-binding protein [Actinomycetota bacterium]|nr:plastocyanin/azurin family copper-binding protein [Actinomycetota bacterium]
MSKRPWGKVLGLAGAVTMASLVPMATAGATTATKSRHLQISMPNSCAGGCYRPATGSIRSGGTVVWTNKSSAPHTVTRCTVADCGVDGGSGADSAPNSGVLDTTGSKYQFTFVGKGTYVYFCQIHGYAAMHGTITVS